MKKIIALACAVVMIVSMFAISTSAAVDGATVTLAGSVEDIGGYDYIKVVISATIPDTLVPYKATAGAPPLFTQTYEGCMIQGLGFDIEVPAGVTYIDAMSTTASYVNKKDDISNSGKVKLYQAYTGAYSEYYAGEVAELATLYFYAADMTQTYNFNATSTKIGLVDVSADGTVVPREYGNADFTVTNAVVAPEVEEEPVYDEVETVTAIVPDTDPIEGENVTYTSVAKFIGSLNLGDIKDALVGPDAELRSAGIKIGDAVKHTFDIAGDGTVEYKVLFWGITADQANNLGMSTFYKVYDIVD